MSVSPTPPDDPLAARPPTSHERRAGVPWDASYGSGPPPWDIGAPQPAFVRLAAEVALAGPVLDAGCGTGENALHLAALGLPVLGVDVAPSAVAMARRKAAERGIDAEFAVADALRLQHLGRTFATVLDCGLFHSFDGEERRRYAASLASVTAEGGRCCILCFSDAEPDAVPHPVSRSDLYDAFGARHWWKVEELRPEHLLTRMHPDGAPAWLSIVRRAG